MKDRNSKIYFIMLFLLVSIVFLYDSNQSSKITGKVVTSAEKTYELCGEKVYLASNNQEIEDIAIITINGKIVQIKIIFNPDPKNNPFVIGDEDFIFNYIRDRYDFQLKDGTTVYVQITKKHEDCGWIKSPQSEKVVAGAQVANCEAYSPKNCPADECKIQTKVVENGGGCTQKTSQVIESCVGKICTSVFPTSNERTLNYKFGTKNFKITVQKSPSGYKFTDERGKTIENSRIDNGRNDRCSFYSLDYIKESEIYSYVFNKIKEEVIDSRLLCYYEFATQYTSEEIYVFTTGKDLTYCPSPFVSTDAPPEGCLSPIFCQKTPSHKVSYGVIIKEDDCNGWQALEANPYSLPLDQDQLDSLVNSRIDTCITELNTEENQEQGTGSECINQAPSIRVSGKNALDFRIGNKCELQWTVSDKEDLNLELGYNKFIGDEIAAVEQIKDVPAMQRYFMYDKNGKIPASSEATIKRTISGFVKDKGFGIDSKGAICTTEQQTTLLEQAHEVSIQLVTNEHFPGKRLIDLGNIIFEVQKRDYGITANRGGRTRSEIQRFFSIDECKMVGTIKTTVINKWDGDLFAAPEDVRKAIASGLAGTVDFMLKGKIEDKDRISIVDKVNKKIGGFGSFIVSVVGENKLKININGEEQVARLLVDQDVIILTAPPLQEITARGEEDGDPVEEIWFAIMNGNTEKETAGGLLRDNKEITMNLQAIKALYEKYVSGTIDTGNQPYFDWLRNSVLPNIKECFCKR